MALFWNGLLSQGFSGGRVVMTAKFHVHAVLKNAVTNALFLVNSLKQENVPKIKLPKPKHSTEDDKLLHNNIDFQVFNSRKW